jgi:hypothetical protein
MRVSQGIRGIASKGKRMPTNKELEAQLAEMLERNEELAQRVLKMEEAQPVRPTNDYPDLPTSFRDAPQGGGWVVRTPNKAFSGDTCSIRFVQGMAVITKETDGAESKVRLLISEYGYSAQPVAEADLNSFNRYIAENLATLMGGKSPDTAPKYAGVTPVFGGVVRGG